MKAKREGTKNGEVPRWILAHVDHNSRDCLIWPFARGKSGYGNCYWEGQFRNAHRVMCELVNGPVPSQDHEAAHSCGKGDTGCVNPAHLAWKTRSENNNQKTKHGTQLRGTKQPMAKLDELQVREIRKMKGRANYIEISAKYGISKQQVCRIMKRQAWAWL